MPPHGTEVWVASEYGDVFIAVYNKDHEAWYADESSDDELWVAVSHWHSVEKPQHPRKSTSG